MGAPNVEVLILNKGEIESLITRKEVVDAVELAFKSDGEGQLIQPQKEPMWMDANKLNFLMAMPAYLKSINTAGVKWVNVYWDQQPGIPATWGDVLILNNPRNGLPYAIMDATSITNLRTAGGHAVVAAKYLAKKDSKILAIIGCGAEARTGLAGFNDMFPLELVKCYDIKPEQMASFQKEMIRQFPLKIRTTTSPKEAVDGSDIVLMATSAQEPVVFEPWIPESCFVVALYSFFDLDPALSKKADKWVIGSRTSDSHRIVERTEYGKKKVMLSWDDVYADMGEIVIGKKPGRESDKERILYTHLGMGAHDIAVAKVAYDKARKGGLGTMVRLI